MGKSCKFRDLSIGDTFDWVDPTPGASFSYAVPCVKISQRIYKSFDGYRYEVGSINAKVYHVNSFTRPAHI